MRTLLNACKTFITQYITIHHNAMSRGVVPTRRLTWSEDVWQCLTVSNVSDKCLTWFAQPSTLILCRRHHWWSRTFCCPVASDICINSTGVDTSRETLRSQCQGESVTCDPKPADWCSDVFWQVMESLQHQHEWTIMRKTNRSINV